MPPLSLQRLQNDRAGLVTDQCFHTVQIIKLREFHTRYKGLKRLSVRIMSCHGHSAERLPWNEFSIAMNSYLSVPFVYA